MDSITSTQLANDISELLNGADLTTITSKKIRKLLEEKYSTDLLSRKNEIDKLAMEAIIKLTSVKSEKTSTSRPKDVKHQVKKESLSDAASGSDSELDEPPAKRQKSEKVKKEATNGSKHDHLDDEDLARKLQEEEEEEAGGRRTRHGNKPSKTKKTKKKSSKTAAKGSDDSDEGDDAPKKRKNRNPGRTNKYTEPCILSPQLANIMNETRLKRSDVVKKMWAIVKERNLYDPRNKQFMICDEQMQTVFGCKRVRIFGMMKTLKNHIFSPDQYEGGAQVDD